MHAVGSDAEVAGERCGRQACATGGSPQIIDRQQISRHPVDAAATIDNRRRESGHGAFVADSTDKTIKEVLQYWFA